MMTTRTTANELSSSSFLIALKRPPLLGEIISLTKPKRPNLSFSFLSQTQIALPIKEASLARSCQPPLTQPNSTHYLSSNLSLDMSSAEDRCASQPRREDSMKSLALVLYMLIRRTSRQLILRNGRSWSKGQLMRTASFKLTCSRCCNRMYRTHFSLPTTTSSLIADLRSELMSDKVYVS